MFGAVISLGLCSKYRSSYSDIRHVKKAGQSWDSGVVVGDDMFATIDINNTIISVFASAVFINSLKFLWLRQHPLKTILIFLLKESNTMDEMLSILLFFVHLYFRNLWAW